MFDRAEQAVVFVLTPVVGVSRVVAFFLHKVQVDWLLIFGFFRFSLVNRQFLREIDWVG